MRLAAILATACVLLLAACDQKPVEQPGAVATCATEWSKCKDNEDLVKNWVSWAGVPGACMEVAENQAQQDGTPLWTGTPFTAPALPGDVYVKSGKAVAVEPEVQVRQPSGASIRAKMVCEYDLKLGKVTGLYTLPLQ